jgi:Lamin Tail Domain
MACILVLVTACSTAPVAEAKCAGAILPGDLVITEILADPTGPDEGKEWFEIFNATAATIELDGLAIVHSRADGSRAKTHVMATSSIPAGGYLVLGNTVSELLPKHMAYGYAADLGDLYNSDSGKLTLSCGAIELDVAIYDRVKSGRSRAFDGGAMPDYLANDEGRNWCEAGFEFDAGNFGTPGQRNDDCEVVTAGRCSDGGVMRDAVAPEPGDLVITEVMPNPAKANDATGEWLEVRVARDVDLNGLMLDRLGDSAPPVAISSETCVRVQAGSFAILGRSRDAAVNGMLPRVDAVFSLSLLSGSATAPGDVQLLMGHTLIDGVRWTKSSSGKSLQLDPDFVDASANDDERVFCDAVTAYGAGDQGTPGTANAQCPVLPPAGMCNQLGTLRPVDRPRPGQLVITELMANPAGIDADQEWFEIKNVGADAFDLNGLSLDRAGDSAQPSAVLAADCKPIAPGGYAVFARSADPQRNGMLPRVDATYTFSSSDAGNIQVLDGAAVLDAVTWTDAPNHASAQLDPFFTTATGNDDASHFCAATVAYGTEGNQGTPGGANRACP